MGNKFDAYMDQINFGDISANTRILSGYFTETHCLREEK